MKVIGTLVVLLSLLVNVSCGGKKGGGGNNNNLPVYNQLNSQYGQNPVPATSNALFNPQSGEVELGGYVYKPNVSIYGIQGASGYGVQPQIQLGTQYLSYAYQQIQMNRSYVPAYNDNQGVYKFNVRVTGYIMQTGNPQSPQVLILSTNVQPF